MDFQAADFIRAACFVMFGVGVTFMVLTNVIAFLVLRPQPQIELGKRKLGFLWWHVSAISLSFLCYGAVSLDAVQQRVNEPELTWRSPVVLIGSIVFAAAQVIIFTIERRRLVHARAREQFFESR